MPLTEPSELSGARPQVSDRALDLAADLAKIALTKFRFRMGCFLIVFGVVVFFIGELKHLQQYFSDDFRDRSWTIAMWLFGTGLAFSGKEVVESFGNAIKSMRS